MTVIDRFERLRAYGDLESIWPVRRLYGGAWWIGAIRNTVVLVF